MLYMPVWSLEELHSCFNYCYREFKNVVNDRFYHWGGSARHVFLTSDEEIHTTFNHILKEGSSVTEIIARLESDVYGENSQSKFQKSTDHQGLKVPPVVKMRGRPKGHSLTTIGLAKKGKGVDKLVPFIGLHTSQKEKG